MKLYNSKISPFAKPIFVTRPFLPDLIKVMEKLTEVWGIKWLTNMGPQHLQLENRLKEVLKVSNLSLFNNGTIALMTALKSLDVSGEVITTPFTFAATPHAIHWINARPVFCDIDPVTMNIDPAKIEKLITPKTTALLPVHVFGVPCDVDEIQAIADCYGLKVIYDAAHAFGVELNGKGIGTYGDISMISFHATKLFHTIEGGALTYNDNAIKTHLDLLKNFGIKNEHEVVLSGINGKMNEIQAAIGLLVLDYQEAERKKRKILIETYRRYLKDVEGVFFHEELNGVKNNYQYFVIRINAKLFGCSRDHVYEKFKEYNVFARKYFYPLCSEFACYRELPSADPANLPTASLVAEEVLSLPLYGELGQDEIEKICTILHSFSRSGLASRKSLAEEPA